MAKRTVADWTQRFGIAVTRTKEAPADKNPTLRYLPSPPEEDNTAGWEEVMVDGVLVRRLVPIPMERALADHNWSDTRGWRRLGRR